MRRSGAPWARAHLERQRLPKNGHEVGEEGGGFPKDWRAADLMPLRA